LTFHVPRLLIAGTGSGCGKTTVTCALLQALVCRGVSVSAMKCGPDYIDPMFHSRIIGAKASNLDLFFYPENTANFLLARNARDCGVTVLEGVMGYYDGLGLTSDRASAYHAAKATQTPAVLVVNAAGASLSVVAAVEGFVRFRPDSGIRGVILNNCSPMVYPALAKAIRERFEDKIRPLGFLPKIPECALESRHLGLVTADEVAGLKEKMERLGAQAEKSLDVNGLLALSRQAEDIRCEPLTFPRGEPVRIGVAQDRAFCFYYADNLALLEELGAEIVPFSPMADSHLPENLHGVYLGGGYPELYAQRLSDNRAMRASLRAALEGGLPCVAECGGFMYLTQEIEGYPMVGLLPGKCYNTGKLTRFGYVRITAGQDNLLCRAGQSFPAHEFHHYDCTEPGRDFRAEKISGRGWACAYGGEHLYAGYPHIPFYAMPELARSFYEACRKEKHRHAGNH